MPRTGLIIGKFLPPHLGHLHLIAEAQKQVDELTILVCSLPDEPIPGSIRTTWMRELSPGATVIHVTDENPSEPHQHPEFWELWTRTIRARVPHGPDIVFSSEDYGDELARHLGARHVSIDRDRLRFPITGTAIRERPFANWQYIPECVCPWFAKRVVLTGSECVGKTTLAQDLARHFATVWVREFGREYVDTIGRWPDASDVDPIARGQIALEEASLRKANRIAIQDTDLISTAVYAEHYYGSCPAWIIDETMCRKASLYLLLDIDVPWIPDPPNRDRGHMREAMQALFRDALAARGIEWVDIRGNWDERRERAIQAVEKVLRTGY